MDPCISSLQQLFIAKTGSLSLILPVILTFIVSKKNVHVSAVVGKHIFPDQMLFKGMGNALYLCKFCVRLIKAAEQHDQKGHVIRKADLPQLSVILFQRLAQAAVIRVINIKLFKFHFSFIDDNISKHSFFRLTSSDKGLSAFGTSDLDLSLSPWDPDLLLTGWTLVNMMGLTLLCRLLPSGKFLSYLIFITQINGIFRLSLINVAGEHPKVGPY